MTDNEETVDFSPDMTSLKPEQETIVVKSVYEAMCKVLRLHAKLHGSKGRFSDAVQYDLVEHSAFAGHFFLVKRGELAVDEIANSVCKASVKGLPWLTDEEKALDPELLFERFRTSVPGHHDGSVQCNFKAEHPDNLTDDQLMQGMPRAEARTRLEAWMLCAAIDGTLAGYVTSRPTWKEGFWWWSPAEDPGEPGRLVILTDWWKRDDTATWNLQGCRLADGDGNTVAMLDTACDGKTERMLKCAPDLYRMVRQLTREAFSLETKTGYYPMDNTIADANRLLKLIDDGKNK